MKSTEVSDDMKCSTMQFADTVDESTVQSIAYKSRQKSIIMMNCIEENSIYIHVEEVQYIDLC
jgi:hypothetical protein